MIKKIENEYLAVEINETGAEVFSIKSKKTNIEYLWQGDAEFWGNRSTVIFPVCGRIYSGKYKYNGTEYEMPIHGFAKLFNFDSRQISQEKIEFELKSNEETKKYYPFDFIFIVKYSLKNNLLKTEFIVKNIGLEDMYFSCGGHPGFNVPFTNEDNFEDYYLEFTKNELNRLIFSDTCFNTNKTEKFSLNKKKLQLSHNLFDNDALFFETETDKVKLKSKKSKCSLEISYKNMNCIGIWHTPKTDAPFICIEPWHGLPSMEGCIDNLKTKKEVIKLGVYKTYDNFYMIKIVEE